MKFPFKLGPRALLLLVIIVVVLLIVVGWLILAFNGLVAKKENANAQCREVDNQYQRKFDLIPALTGVVGNLTAFERDTLTNITLLRSQWGNATTIEQKANVSGQFDSVITAVRVQVENYPNLNSIWLAEGLMTELAGTENRITVARMRYIEDARDYNIKIQQFPDNMVAGMFGFTRIAETCGL